MCPCACSEAAGACPSPALRGSRVCPWLPGRAGAAADPPLCPQITSLLKDHERIQAGQTSAPSDDDSDIKKIKKVGGGGGGGG